MMLCNTLFNIYYIIALYYLIILLSKYKCKNIKSKLDLYVI